MTVLAKLLIGFCKSAGLLLFSTMFIRSILKALEAKFSPYEASFCKKVFSEREGL